MSASVFPQGARVLGLSHASPFRATRRLLAKAEPPPDKWPLKCPDVPVGELAPHIGDGVPQRKHVSAADLSYLHRRTRISIPRALPPEARIGRKTAWTTKFADKLRPPSYTETARWPDEFFMHTQHARNVLPSMWTSKVATEPIQKMMHFWGADISLNNSGLRMVRTMRTFFYELVAWDQATRVWRTEKHAFENGLASTSSSNLVKSFATHYKDIGGVAAGRRRGHDNRRLRREYIRYTWRRKYRMSPPRQPTPGTRGQIAYGLHQFASPERQRGYNSGVNLTKSYYGIGKGLPMAPR
eukprot:TRINITY_DN3191_c0_g1_i1.p1 TRINITY_DN3191_c0_g1~~TRINITY_DN3191_c0_g1_i1.p1  ORF type:complete len:298 (+),score=23.97 TRINITY_DN3191_c0_g1_i1:101-994(+)